MRMLVFYGGMRMRERERAIGLDQFDLLALNWKNFRLNLPVLTAVFPLEVQSQRSEEDLI